LTSRDDDCASSGERDQSAGLPPSLEQIRRTPPQELADLDNVGQAHLSAGSDISTISARPEIDVYAKAMRSKPTTEDRSRL